MATEKQQMRYFPAKFSVYCIAVFWSDEALKIAFSFGRIQLNSQTKTDISHYVLTIKMHIMTITRSCFGNIFIFSLFSTHLHQQF